MYCIFHLLLIILLQCWNFRANEFFDLKNGMYVAYQDLCPTFVDLEKRSANPKQLLVLREIEHLIPFLWWPNYWQVREKQGMALLHTKNRVSKRCQWTFSCFYRKWKVYHAYYALMYINIYKLKYSKFCLGTNSCRCKSLPIDYTEVFCISFFFVTSF